MSRYHEIEKTVRECGLSELISLKELIEKEIKLKHHTVEKLYDDKNLLCKIGLHDYESFENKPHSIKNRTFITHKVCAKCGKHIYGEFYVPDL